MLQHPFAIEFYYPGEAGESIKKYQAIITTLSRSFNLFKVTGIKKFHNNQMMELHECYHLTPHPLTEEKDDTWKDAVTRTTDDFLQAIGKAIEKHIYLTKEVAPFLN